MKSFARSVALVLLSLAVPASASAQSDAVLDRELDAFWDAVSQTVAEGDAAGYAALYHPDAVVVMLGATMMISEAMAGWQQGFDDTAAGRMEAGVEFRITNRRVSENAAFDTGIFRYFSRAPGAQPAVVMVHFEGLMVKKDGRWLMTMENQKEIATEAEWTAAAGGM